MSAAFVVDCSMAMAWCFPDEATPGSRALLDRMAVDAAAVPGLWYLEVTNVLALAERKARIDPIRVSEFIALLEGFDLEIDDHTPARAFSHLLPLCRDHGLTSYHATYLDLALRRRLALATLDAPLRSAAKKLGVALMGK